MSPKPLLYEPNRARRHGERRSREPETGTVVTDDLTDRVRDLTKHARLGAQGTGIQTRQADPVQHHRVFAPDPRHVRNRRAESVDTYRIVGIIERAMQPDQLDLAAHQCLGGQPTNLARIDQHTVYPVTVAEFGELLGGTDDDTARSR